jgi:hypothetical protein
MQVEDAQKAIVRWIREAPTSTYPNYGYDIYISNVIRWVLERRGLSDRSETDRTIRALSPVFYAAAWELCRRGIIRPGVREYALQATEHGNAGEGYSVTPFGRTWAAESDRDDFVPTEPERFGQMLAPFQKHFGPGFVAGRSTDQLRGHDLLRTSS